MRHELAEDAVNVLLENAVKFSPGRAHVRIEVLDEPSGVTLRVSDRGRGFQPEIAERIFEPFTVMDTLHHREGSALNLARIRAIVQAHGGNASAESPGSGQGATFTLRFPAADASAANGNAEQRKAA